MHASTCHMCGWTGKKPAPPSMTAQQYTNSLDHRAGMHDRVSIQECPICKQEMSAILKRLKIKE